MTLSQWKTNGWLKSHKTSPQEVANLLEIVDRDLHDAASGGISADWRFGIAYNAALKLCAILLYAEGYIPEKALQHYRVIQSLPLILGDHRKPDVDYLDACRVKRNIVEYDRIGEASNDEADELIEFAQELRASVVLWIKSNHSSLM